MHGYVHPVFPESGSNIDTKTCLFAVIMIPYSIRIHIIELIR